MMPEANERDSASSGTEQGAERILSLIDYKFRRLKDTIL